MRRKHLLENAGCGGLLPPHSALSIYIVIGFSLLCRVNDYCKSSNKDLSLLRPSFSEREQHCDTRQARLHIAVLSFPQRTAPGSAHVPLESAGKARYVACPLPTCEAPRSPHFPAHRRIAGHFHPPAVQRIFAAGMICTTWPSFPRTNRSVFKSFSNSAFSGRPAYRPGTLHP